MLLLFGITTTGIYLLASGWRRRSRTLKSLGAILLLFVTAVIARALIFENALEWNVVVSDSELIGTWSDKTETLTLKSDGTFSYRTAAGSTTGQWDREDWNLNLKSEQAVISVRVVRYFHHPRIMTHPPDDPDAWDGNPGLEKR
ncbi:MAG: hypothetical protein ACAI37_16270 [Chthoniobacter sp.]